VRTALFDGDDRHDRRSTSDVRAACAARGESSSMAGLREVIPVDVYNAVLGRSEL
jgi:hypothetical protein